MRSAPISRRARWLPVLAAAALVHGTAHARVLYHVVDIGVPDGSTDTVANGINDEGLIVGTANDANGSTAFEYTVESGFTPLVGLDGATLTNGLAVNSAGVVVGSSEVLYCDEGGVDCDSYSPAVRWSDPTKADPLAPVSAYDKAVAINASGVMVGSGTSVQINSPTLASVWAADTTSTNLSAVLGGSSDAALGINDAGQVVGEYGDASIYGIATNAFLWTSADGAHDLPSLPDATWTVANAINGAGAAVGMSGVPFALVATLWPASPAPAPVPLGLLETLPRSAANAINDAGVVVGYADDLNDGSRKRAWVWTQGSGMQDLNAISDAADADLTLFNAAAINASGQIVGTASVGPYNANEHGFLATPVPEAPAAWPALAALFLLRRRVRD